MTQEHQPLTGKKIAILVTDGVEQVELTEPRDCLQAAGAQTVLVSPKKDQVKAWDKTDWGETFPVDLPLEKARADDFDALLLPGGVMNPDKLRMDHNAVHFVKEFFMQAKPVGAICHGPVLLIEAGVVKDRTLTSYPSIKADLSNARAKWLDREVVVENGLVTSRRPQDIPAFNKAIIEVFAKDRYELQKPMEAFPPVAAPRS